MSQRFGQQDPSADGESGTYVVQESSVPYPHQDGMMQPAGRDGAEGGKPMRPSGGKFKPRDRDNEDTHGQGQGLQANEMAMMSAGPNPAMKMAVESMMPIPRDWTVCTTIMMRNIPNKYTQRMLFTEVTDNGFLGTFDFLYLPIDPDTLANRGYAFFNFIDHSFAWMFKLTYDGRKMQRFNSSKVVHVVPATLQGFEANHLHYSSARVNRGDPAARPLFLRDTGNSGEDKGLSARRRGRRGLAIGARENESGGGGPRPGVGAGGCSASGGGGGGGGGKGAGCGGYAQGAPGAQNDVPSAPSVARFCPHCGSPIQPMFQFCPACGESLAESMNTVENMGGYDGGASGW